jgi:hypothetical protein
MTSFLFGKIRSYTSGWMFVKPTLFVYPDVQFIWNCLLFVYNLFSCCNQSSHTHITRKDINFYSILTPISMKRKSCKHSRHLHIYRNIVVDQGEKQWIIFTHAFTWNYWTKRDYSIEAVIWLIWLLCQSNFTFFCKHISNTVFIPLFLIRGFINSHSLFIDYKLTHIL